MDRLKEALNLSDKCYHSEFFALSNVSFQVEKGEILGIMGRNGAGKSTLLKIITGVLNPTYGTIKISGRISSLLELGAGFNLEYTGIENIHFYSTLMGLSKVEIMNRLDDIISFAEIGDYIYQPVKTYSSGMFARLAFSCAINVDPDVLIVDEILSVGDIRFQAKCFKKFKEFKEKGVTILYVGHDISTMRTFCDRCMWLNNGHVVDIGEPTYISAKYTEFMYLDEISQFTEYKKLDEQIVVATEIDDQPIISNANLVPALDINSVQNIEDAMRKNQSLSHWGPKKGLISNIRMFTEDFQAFSHCCPFERLKISMRIEYDNELTYDYLSVAFSIKSKDGIDLIVKTTWDDGIRFNHVKNAFDICFELEPRLTTGDYYLVVALENRKEPITSYYEYIEGAWYFKIFEDKGLLGKFLPDIKTVMNEVVK